MLNIYFFYCIKLMCPSSGKNNSHDVESLFTSIPVEETIKGTSADI